MAALALSHRRWLVPPFLAALLAAVGARGGAAALAGGAYAGLGRHLLTNSSSAPPPAAASKGAACAPPKLSLDGQCVCPVVYDDESGNCDVEKELDPSISGWCPLVYTGQKFRAFAGKKKRISSKSIPGTAYAAERKGFGQDIMGKFASCAVVGSSDRLLKQPKGAEIDTHTAVFRCNDAPIRKLAAQVGSKTTVRIQNFAYCGNHESKAERCVFYSYMQPKGSRGCPNKAKCKMAGVSQAAAYWSLEYWSIASPPKNVGKDPGRPKTSAGFFAIGLALHLCAKVDIYGYELGSAFGHYYKKTNPKKGNLKSRSKVFVSGKKGTGHKWKWEKACIKALSTGVLPRVMVH